MMPVVSLTCSDHEKDHEKAQMFHLHVGLNWVKDNQASLICLKDRPSGL